MSDILPHNDEVLYAFYEMILEYGFDVKYVCGNNDSPDQIQVDKSMGPFDVGGVYIQRGYHGNENDLIGWTLRDYSHGKKYGGFVFSPADPDSEEKLIAYIRRARV